eukprot:CAMPEP_0198724140 /NCGR_PEP_ID=MMETSP1475-20131203/1644_1 /TAXON_ID= ORGANISM="Unidentified sp., Strain CCMP1999" /NCGR_SAMPLE_ID=MMETSP1475 /ASSEMBLY_ACC=CAM_ASM_001111 /LENGTH=402 /DNA_ID=CAMNT_0044485565 /DNA_START=130 /DNA_END=1340 /DNA_ORIENTATION=+
MMNLDTTHGGLAPSWLRHELRRPEVINYLLDPEQRGLTPEMLTREALQTRFLIQIPQPLRSTMESDLQPLTLPVRHMENLCFMVSVHDDDGQVRVDPEVGMINPEQHEYACVTTKRFTDGSVLLRLCWFDGLLHVCDFLSDPYCNIFKDVSSTVVNMDCKFCQVLGSQCSCSQVMQRRHFESISNSHSWSSAFDAFCRLHKSFQGSATAYFKPTSAIRNITIVIDDDLKESRLTNLMANLMLVSSSRVGDSEKKMLKEAEAEEDEAEEDEAGEDEAARGMESMLGELLQSEPRPGEPEYGGPKLDRGYGQEGQGAERQRNQQPVGSGSNQVPFDGIVTRDNIPQSAARDDGATSVVLPFQVGMGLSATSRAYIYGEEVEMLKMSQELSPARTPPPARENHAQ